MKHNKIMVGLLVVLGLTGTVTLPAQSASGKSNVPDDGEVEVKPTTNETVIIHHKQWNDTWAIIFPEVVFIGENADKYKFSKIRPEWRATGNGGWKYNWMPDEMTPEFNKKNPKVELIAEIYASGNVVSLAITLVNRSQIPALKMRVDGGCFQAQSATFRCAEREQADEVRRSFLYERGKMISLAGLPRSIAERCSYHANPSLEYATARWMNAINFWGRSDYVLDAPPGIIGMVSKDGKRAVAMAYQDSVTVSENADSRHHCLHSRPYFGDLQPGQSLTRRGMIVFGSSIQELGGFLHNTIR